ncbi:MAG: polysaccharide deacetylase family protein [Bacteroidetes bacterium]|nr:polysaccharide deacetylase family protein [Bacteroidota bacterium]
MSVYQLPVLLYHRIVHSKKEVGRHKIYVFKDKFEAQLKFLKENGYETLTFQDLKSPLLPSPVGEGLGVRSKIILTFDDGYEDNYTILFPLLKKYGFKAVIYLVTQKKDNSWGVQEGEPVFKMMNEKQIREMSDYGIEFGGHTQNHPDLTKISIEEAKKEIEGCKKDVEAITGKPALSFAYPFGALNEKVKSAVKDAGYNFGIATTSGANSFSDDRFQIRRIEIRPQNGLARFKYKASGYYFQKSLLSSFFAK